MDKENNITRLLDILVKEGDMNCVVRVKILATRFSYNPFVRNVGTAFAEDRDGTKIVVLVPIKDYISFSELNDGEYHTIKAHAEGVRLLKTLTYIKTVKER